MNPNAKEFVPAHILKKRQDEADQVGELSEQLDGVSITRTQEAEDKQADGPNDVHKPEKGIKEEVNSSIGKEINQTPLNSAEDRFKPHNLENNNHTNHDEGDDFTDPEDLEHSDDRFLLNEGENICEFNGEQFIIPGDDDKYGEPYRHDYDFGNDEDNEDEEVCSAFEEFLGNLPH